MASSEPTKDLKRRYQSSPPPKFPTSPDKHRVASPDLKRARLGDVDRTECIPQNILRGPGPDLKRPRCQTPPSTLDARMEPDPKRPRLSEVVANVPESGVLLDREGLEVPQAAILDTLRALPFQGGDPATGEDPRYHSNNRAASPLQLNSTNDPLSAINLAQHLGPVTALLEDVSETPSSPSSTTDSAATTTVYLNPDTPCHPSAADQSIVAPLPIHPSRFYALQSEVVVDNPPERPLDDECITASNSHTAQSTNIGIYPSSQPKPNADTVSCPQQPRGEPTVPGTLMNVDATHFDPRANNVDPNATSWHHIANLRKPTQAAPTSDADTNAVGQSPLSGDANPTAFIATATDWRPTVAQVVGGSPVTESWNHSHNSQASHVDVNATCLIAANLYQPPRLVEPNLANHVATDLHQTIQSVDSIIASGRQSPQPSNVDANATAQVNRVKPNAILHQPTQVVGPIAADTSPGPVAADNTSAFDFQVNNIDATGPIAANSTTAFDPSATGWNPLALKLHQPNQAVEPIVPSGSAAQTGNVDANASSWKPQGPLLPLVGIDNHVDATGPIAANSTTAQATNVDTSATGWNPLALKLHQPNQAVESIVPSGSAAQTGNVDANASSWKPQGPLLPLAGIDNHVDATGPIAANSTTAQATNVDTSATGWNPLALKLHQPNQAVEPIVPSGSAQTGNVDANASRWNPQRPRGEPIAINHLDTASWNPVAVNNTAAFVPQVTNVDPSATGWGPLFADLRQPTRRAMPIVTDSLQFAQRGHVIPTSTSTHVDGDARKYRVDPNAACWTPLRFSLEPARIDDDSMSSDPQPPQPPLGESVAVGIKPRPAHIDCSYPFGTTYYPSKTSSYPFGTSSFNFINVDRTTGSSRVDVNAARWDPVSVQPAEHHNAGRPQITANQRPSRPTTPDYYEARSEHSSAMDCDSPVSTIPPSGPSRIDPSAQQWEPVLNEGAQSRTSFEAADNNIWHNSGDQQVEDDADEEDNTSNSDVDLRPSTDTKQYPRRRPGRHRRLTPPPRPAGNAPRSLDIVHDDPYFVQLKADVRALCDTDILELPHKAINLPDPADVTAYETNPRAAVKPSLEDFRPDLLSAGLASRWNKQLSVLFAARLIKELKRPYEKADIEHAFMRHLVYLQKHLRKERLPRTSSVELRLSDEKIEVARDARRRALRHRRAGAAKVIAKAFSGMDAHVQLWSKLPHGVVSGDETDHAGVERYAITKLPWRSAAPAVIRWFRSFDQLHMSTRISPTGRAGRGRFPHVRVESQRADPAPPVAGLPMNFYSEAFLRSLDPEEVEALNVQPEVDLTLPRKVQILAARYQRVFRRGDVPLPKEHPSLARFQTGNGQTAPS